MIEYIELGPVPAEENCVQVSQDNYFPAMREEARKYANLLRAYFSDLNKIAFKIKSFSHDFGSYVEVCVFYNSNDEESVDQAFTVEANLPTTWKELEQGKFIKETV